MAHQLDDVPVRSGRPAKYPWDEWLDGSGWRLDRNIDFLCSAESMRAAVLYQARKRDICVYITVAAGEAEPRRLPGSSVWIKAYPDRRYAEIRALRQELEREWSQRAASG